MKQAKKVDFVSERENRTNFKILWVLLCLLLTFCKPCLLGCGAEGWTCCNLRSSHVIWKACFTNFVPVFQLSLMKRPVLGQNLFVKNITVGFLPLLSSFCFPSCTFPSRAESFLTQQKTVCYHFLVTHFVHNYLFWHWKCSFQKMSLGLTMSLSSKGKKRTVTECLLEALRGPQGGHPTTALGLPVSFHSCKTSQTKSSLLSPHP
jgi:hypothetical protein